jgi:hypothetical protein
MREGNWSTGYRDRRSWGILAKGIPPSWRDEAELNANPRACVTVPKTPDPDAGKDPTAMALGRRGGLKGGKVRAAKMTKKQRTAAARKAATARWAK